MALLITSGLQNVRLRYIFWCWFVCNFHRSKKKHKNTKQPDKYSIYVYILRSMIFCETRTIISNSVMFVWLDFFVIFHQFYFNIVKRMASIFKWVFPLAALDLTHAHQLDFHKNTHTHTNPKITFRFSFRLHSYRHSHAHTHIQFS